MRFGGVCVVRFFAGSGGKRLADSFPKRVWLSCTVAALDSGAGNCLKYFENTGVRPFSGWRGRVAEKRETCQS